MLPVEPAIVKHRRPMLVSGNWKKQPRLLLENQIVNRLVRFGAVGLVNTLFGYSIFVAIYLLLGDHNIAIVVATFVGVIFNFFSTGRLVFNSSASRSFLPFICGYVVTCGLNVILLTGLADRGVNPIVGQILVLPLVVLLSFAINQWLVFRHG